MNGYHEATAAPRRAEFPKEILSEIATWMAANGYSRLTINMAERTKFNEPHRVTMEASSYERMTVEKDLTVGR